MNESYDYDLSEDEDDLEQLGQAVAEQEKQPRQHIQRAEGPLFQTLLMQIVEPDDAVLVDFAQYVAGLLSDELGAVAAKGGAFFRMKEAEGVQDTERYHRDQTLRGHLVNGMLPVLRIARLLADWDADRFRYWRPGEPTERLFVAGYMLHDYMKLPAVHSQLVEAGFREYEPPSERLMPTLEEIFREWCARLGLDKFLEPIGGADAYLHDLIFIACNTQQMWGTARAPAHYTKMHAARDSYLLATELSHLADVLAYIAPNPRALVADKTIRDTLTKLAFAPQQPGGVVARLTYHHVAENRGLLLNFIHDGALEALTVEDQRVPLLYAPSGVVYLERDSAPSMPDPAALVERIVRHIREKCGIRLVEKGKDAKRGNVGIQTGDSYDDLFNLSEYIIHSVKLVDTLVRNNKSAGRLEPVQTNGWPGGSNIPPLPTDAKDARLDKLAEWAALLERKFRDRLPGFDLAAWLLPRLGIADLGGEFETLRNHPAAKKGGVSYWWFWAAAHVLARQPGIEPQKWVEALDTLARELVAALPADLPETARANEETWNDLTAYVARVLTLGGAKTTDARASGSAELARYVRAKGGRGGATCALCGSDFETRKQVETAVAFQPGVYTARVRMGASENKRSICSICALEQLLRQLFIDNLDSGQNVENQRVRYLSFYPSYFFTPETLRLVQRAYTRLKDVRLAGDLRRELASADLLDATFWQRLGPFWITEEVETSPSKRLLRYGQEAQATFLMVGLRNFGDPSDAESWVIPTLLALALPLCLDVKVVASESGVPLLLEADELPETVWLDGAHPAIQEVLGDARLDIDRVLGNVEEPGALARLAATYLIHLDCEYTPPDEKWHRLPPIAHALAESPLYVFHYFKKREREGVSLGRDQVSRYMYYAEKIFAPYCKGDVLMSYARKLVELYRRFYRAKTIRNSNSILRPLSVVSDALLTADTRLFPDAEALVELTYGELYRFMDRVSKGLADGRFPKGVKVAEREQAMREFCATFVNDVFIGVFSRDVAALRGKQLNLLRSACEVLYRDMQQTEWAERGESDEPEEPEEDASVAQ